jgi:hypothetical protein
MAVSVPRLFVAVTLSAVSTVLLITGCQGIANLAAPQTAAASAFVYVVSNPSGNNFAINAFSANSNGQLTPVPGSPFAANVVSIAASRNYLFGTDGTSISSFSIGGNGALTQVSSMSIRQFNPNGVVAELFLDDTGETLYAAHFQIDGANEGYDSFRVDHSTGVLTFLGATFTGCCGHVALHFMANNVYGFAPDCFHSDPSVALYKRNNDGTLMSISGGLDNSPDPTHLCPESVAPGPAGTLAVAFGADGGPGIETTPPQADGVVLAVYSVDSSGFLTTSSTVANMPQSNAGGMIEMSPSGKFLAAGGLGLQVFHFNGGDPITPFTGLLTKDRIEQFGQMAWDNDDNLYTLSQSINKLSVFTVNATNSGPAPGSPYAITNPMGIAIAPRD